MNIRHIPTDRRTHLEVFDALNILDTDATSREVGKSIACAADESSSQDCNRDEKCSVDKDITSVPVKDNPSLQHRASVRDAHLTSKSRLRTSEFLIRQKQAAELLAKRKEAMELLEKQKALEEDPIKASIISGMMEEISNLNAQILSKKRVTEEGLPVISADQAPLADDTGNITKIGFDPHKLLSGIPVLDGKASTVSETPKAIQTPTKAKKRGRIVVAPDGYLPNSSSSAKIIGLKKKSEDVQIQVARRIFTLQDKIKMANELDNKIKAMEASRNAELEVEVEPVRSRLPKNKPKKKPFRETLKVEEMESLSSSQEGTLPNPLIDQTKNSESKKVTPVSLSHAEVQLEEVIKYPEIVVKVLATDWFPANEVYISFYG